MKAELAETFDEAWARGRAMGFDEAIDFALATLEQAGTPKPVVGAVAASPLKPGGAAFGSLDLGELGRHGGTGIV
jgi:hypothetical protein